MPGFFVPKQERRLIMPWIIGKIRISPALRGDFICWRAQSRRVIHHGGNLASGKSLNLFHHFLVGVASFAVTNPAELTLQVFVVLSLDERDMLFWIPFSILAMALGALCLIDPLSQLQVESRAHTIFR